MQAKGRKAKYRAVRCVSDGERFDSRGEARRWAELKLLEETGAIRELRRQIGCSLYVHPAIGAPSCIGKIVLDFAYWILPMGSHAWVQVYEDFKGVMTPLS